MMQFLAILTFVEIGAYEDLSNNLKSIMLILGFILENWKKSPGGFKEGLDGKRMGQC